VRGAGINGGGLLLALKAECETAVWENRAVVTGAGHDFDEPGGGGRLSVSYAAGRAVGKLSASLVPSSGGVAEADAATFRLAAEVEETATR
jgi:hypothetical protein